MVPAGGKASEPVEVEEGVPAAASVQEHYGK